MSCGEEVSGVGNRPVVPQVDSQRALDFMIFFIMDNYRNTTIYLDKLLRYLMDDQVVVIEQKCESRYFTSDNVKDFYKKLSTKISFGKQLAKNVTMRMVFICNLNY